MKITVPCFCVTDGMTLEAPVDHTKIHNVLARMEMFHHFQMTLSGLFLCTCGAVALWLTISLKILEKVS